MRAKEKQGAGRRRAGDLSWVSLRILVSGRTLGKCLCYPPSKSRPNKHSNSQPASQPASQPGRSGFPAFAVVRRMAEVFLFP